MGERGVLIGYSSLRGGGCAEQNVFLSTTLFLGLFTCRVNEFLLPTTQYIFSKYLPSIDSKPYIVYSGLGTCIVVCKMTRGLGSEEAKPGSLIQKGDTFMICPQKNQGK